MALDIKKFVVRFVEEARDHLRRIEEGLTALQSAPEDKELINSVFRSAHTIKGSSRMVKILPISETAHKLEDILGAVREGSLAWSPEIGRLVQQGVDVIATQVDAVADEKVPPDLDEELAALLAGLMVKDSPDPSLNAEESLEAAPLPPPPPPTSAGPHVSPPEVKLKAAETVRMQLSKLDELIKLMGEVVSSHARLHQRLTDIRTMERGATSLTLSSFAHDLRDDVFAQELLMHELHSKALIMRMLPLAIVFEPAQRLVRDLGRSLGKEVDCSVSGMEIELDRQLIDRLSDPVVHLLRNAVDHGIETPADRLAVGKPKTGKLQLSARQDGGWVLVEVSDDGKGLSLDAIRDKAIRKGMMSAEQAGAMTETEVIDLIFEPGFSTNSIITDVSGRGVGMDVVKRCVVDELQGVINVESRPGQGAVFSLRLPMSLAVMRVLQVSAGGQTFAFTAQYVNHLLSVPTSLILTVADRKAVVIQNEFVPVLSLAELLGVSDREDDEKSACLLVVIRVGTDKLALRVDDLVDEADMVIKPLPEHLRHLPLVSGMVMTGKNILVSVLHSPALLDVGRKMRGESKGRDKAAETGRPILKVLVVDDSLNTREIEKDVLEAHGYQVVLAEDGLDGLQKARAGDFDAVLTDVEMPNMDGFTLTTYLRQDERYRHIPIIIITSREKEEDKRRGIQVGADAYIVKGDFDQSNLIATVQSLLG